MRKRIAGLLACMVALCLALAACGGGGGAASDPSADFVGIWRLESIESTNEESAATASEISELAEYGLVCGLELKDDGTGTFVLFGAQESLTWEATGAGKATITIEGNSAEASINGSHLVMADDESSINFVKDAGFDLYAVPEEPEASSDLAGIWRVSSIDSEDEDSSTTEEEMALMDGLGLRCGMELLSDGTGTFVLFGEQLDIRWEASADGSGVLTLEGSPAEFSYTDSTISISADGETMNFTLDPSYDLYGGATMEDLESAFGEVGEDSGLVSSSSGEEFVEMSQIIADDELVTIEIVGKGTDWAGDPFYRIRATNNSDKTIYVTDSWDSFSVNGRMADPVFGVTVKPGTYDEEDMWWSSSDVGDGGMSLLVNVDGQLEVWDDDTYDTLATYDFVVE